MRPTKRPTAALACGVFEADGRIDLLMTDIGLPGGMNGRQLADAARVLRPDLKVLFITGFAEADITDIGVMGPGVGVMTKPFAMDAFALKIRAMMSATPAPQRPLGGASPRGCQNC